MKPIPLLALLLVAGPAGAQSRVYTNADLGRPLSPTRGTVTEEQLRALAERQFRLPPKDERRDGPTIVVMGTTPTFPRSTDELIAMPPQFVSDMYLANEAAFWGATLGGFYGGSPWFAGRSFAPSTWAPSSVAPPLPMIAPPPPAAPVSISGAAASGGIVVSRQGR